MKKRKTIKKKNF